MDPFRWDVAFAALLPIVVLAFVAWLASLQRHDASLVDRFWPLFIAAAAIACFVELPAAGPRATTMLVLGLAWAVRLCAFVTRRNWGHGEDRRYRDIRARNEPGFAMKSLYLVFGLQSLLAWLVSTPFLFGMAAGGPLGPLSALGALVAAFGIAFEGIADAQMARFRDDKAHAGQVMDRGLWRYTRHPNYFGEACVWWGLWLMAASAPGGGWALVSPLLMTVLLLKVSGVSLLEKDIAERRPGYREYVETTNAFLPGPPRRRPHG